MSAGALKRMERVETLARALVAPPVVPDPVALFHAAAGEPDGWQATVLRSAAPRLLLNCSRQSGESTVAATIAVSTVLAEAGALVLLLSPSLRQSQELFRKALDVYHAAGSPVLPETENRLTLELSNGSRLLSLPGTERTVRGFSGVRLLVVDESSRVDDDLYFSLRPMLAVSAGRLIALSTPWGQRGWWFREWTDGGPTWERVRVPADRCPRISAEFLQEERRSLGDLFFRSEYGCEFCDTVDQVFSSEHIQAALDDTLAPLWGAA